jgi:hypothetical protein
MVSCDEKSRQKERYERSSIVFCSSTAWCILAFQVSRFFLYDAEIEQYVGVMPGEIAGSFSQEYPLSHPTRATSPSAPRRVPSLP